MKAKLLLILLASLVFSGCGSDTCENGPVTTSLSAVQSALTVQTPKGDELGVNAYDEIADKKLRHEVIRMDIYSLGSDESLSDLTENRHLAQPVIEENPKYVLAKSGNIECSWNKSSLYEFCYNSERFETSPGVDKSLLKSDNFYFAVADNYLKQEIKPKVTPHFDYFLYKKKYGINGSAPIHEPDNITETIYDIGVAYASTLDGWPVIGPGGKSYIHIMPDGDVIAHKTYRKYPQKRLARLTENDIKSPDEALAELKDKVDFNRTTIVRREFGYYYKDNNSIQNILSPYYVFFFAPTDSRFDTVNDFFVSAVKGEMADMIDKDNALDRKTAKIEHIAPPMR